MIKFAYLYIVKEENDRVQYFCNESVKVLDHADLSLQTYGGIKLKDVINKNHDDGNFQNI